MTGWQEPLDRMKAREQARAETADLFAPVCHAAIRAYEMALSGVTDIPAWDKITGPQRADFTAMVRYCVNDAHISPQGLYQAADRLCGGSWALCEGSTVAVRAPPRPWHDQPAELRRSFALVVHIVRALSVT